MLYMIINSLSKEATTLYRDCLTCDDGDFGCPHYLDDDVFPFGPRPYPKGEGQ